MNDNENVSLHDGVRDYRAGAAAGDVGGLPVLAGWMMPPIYNGRVYIAS